MRCFPKGQSVWWHAVNSPTKQGEVMQDPNVAHLYLVSSGQTVEDRTAPCNATSCSGTGKSAYIFAGFTCRWAIVVFIDTLLVVLVWTMVTWGARDRPLMYTVCWALVFASSLVALAAFSYRKVEPGSSEDACPECHW